MVFFHLNSVWGGSDLDWHKSCSRPFKKSQFWLNTSSPSKWIVRFPVFNWRWNHTHICNLISTLALTKLFHVPTIQWRLWLAYNLKPKHGCLWRVSNSPHPQTNSVAKVNTLIQLLRPQGLIQAKHLIYSDCSNRDGCKIVVEASLIHSTSHD